MVESENDHSYENPPVVESGPQLFSGGGGGGGVSEKDTTHNYKHKAHRIRLGER